MGNGLACPGCPPTPPGVQELREAVERHAAEGQRVWIVKPGAMNRRERRGGVVSRREREREREEGVGGLPLGPRCHASPPPPLASSPPTLALPFPRLPHSQSLSLSLSLDAGGTGSRCWTRSIPFAALWSSSPLAAAGSCKSTSSGRCWWGGGSLTSGHMRWSRRMDRRERGGGM